MGNDVPSASTSTDGHQMSAAPGVKVPGIAYTLSIALAVVTTIATGLSAFGDAMRGPDVMNGSARGTAIVVLFVTVPLLAASMWATTKGSVAALLVWLGGVAHVLYQSVLFLFGTPFNDVFLLYVAMASLALCSLIVILASVDLGAVRARIEPTLPVRPIAIYVWMIVVLNGALWLKTAANGIGTEGTPEFLVGTGLPTNPVYVEDLVFWLPLMAVAALWLWRRLDRGYVVIGSMLVMWFVESITVAVDQWMGHRADPTSDVATLGGAYLFAALAVIGIAPLTAFFRHLRGGHWRPSLT
jgi:hypothetical protein